MTVRAMCEAATVSRAGFYRHQSQPTAAAKDMDLRNEIQKIALEWPAYGRRRITQELRDRGWKVNGKRVRRIMREDNLLCLRRRKFVATTDSNHGLPVYPNLARDMTLSGINQLWMSDITYIRLEEEFVYLAVILDAYSRRVIGWALDRRMDTELPLAALRMALLQRAPAAGLVHHSDRGSVYASQQYTGVLKEHGVTISMSRRGNPYDKAYASYCTSCEPWTTFSGKATPFGEFDALCFSRWIGPGILIQPVVSIIHRIAAKQATIPPGDHALGTDVQSRRHFFER